MTTLTSDPSVTLGGLFLEVFSLHRQLEESSDDSQSVAFQVRIDI